MVMDFIKKILKIIEESTLMKAEDTFTQFLHQQQDAEEKIVTITTTPEGFFVLGVFTQEQWDMALLLSEVTQKDIRDIVDELIADRDIPALVIDPKEY